MNNDTMVKNIHESKLLRELEWYFKGYDRVETEVLSSNGDCELYIEQDNKALQVTILSSGIAAYHNTDTGTLETLELGTLWELSVFISDGLKNNGLVDY